MVGGVNQIPGRPRLAVRVSRGQPLSKEKSMKAMVLREYNQPLRLEEVEVPKISAGELLVRVKACGVCASNLKYVREPADCIILPHILGHEPAGEVVEVGPQDREVGRPGRK